MYILQTASEGQNLKYLMLITADYASIDQATQKLNILGAFTHIVARQFPCKHPRMAIALTLEAELLDTADPKILKVILADADGTELMVFAAEFQIPYGEGGYRPYASFVLELNNLEFPHAGEYIFTVYVDDQPIGHTSIVLDQMQQNP